MTVPATTRSAGPYPGDNSATVFTFGFKVFSVNDIAVVLVSGSTRTVLTQNVHYTVGLNVDQSTSPGGSITYPISGSPLAPTDTITIVGATEYSQTHAIPGGGNFNPEAMERALDRLEFQIQQLRVLATAALRVGDGETLDAFGTAADRADRIIGFDGTGNRALLLPQAGDATDLALDLADPNSLTHGDGQVATKRNVTGGVATTVHDWIEGQMLNVVSDFDADPTSSGDQTAKVQAAINALPARGGIVYVPRGVKFNRKSLTRPQRSTIRYFLDDDTSLSTAEAYFGAFETNELVDDIANANSAGAVNEDRKQARLHPGHIVDVIADDTTHDAYLGVGQSRLEPKRASYNIFNEGMDWWRVVTEHYSNAWSQYSGTSMHAWCPRVTLVGITSASYAPAPAYRQLITGNISGARGYFISSDGTQTVVAWVHGVFQVGETVNYGSGLNTAATITSRAASNAIGLPVMFDHITGAISYGGPPGNVAKSHGFFGDLVVARTLNFGQRAPETTTHPAIWLIDNHLNPAGGYGVSYDTTPAAAFRRLRTRKWNETTMRGMVGATQLKTCFSNSALIETSAFNVATLARTATGKYAITATTALARADYAVLLGRSDVADFPVYKNRATGSLEIWNYNSAGALADLVGEVSVHCVCGDI